MRHTRARRLPTRRVAMLTYAGAQSLDVVGPLEVFAIASQQALLERPVRPPPYAIEMLARRKGPVKMSSGITVVADRPYAAVAGGIDTLVVCGGDVRAALRDRALLQWLRRMAPRVRRLASVCTGAFLLAEAG